MITQEDLLTIPFTPDLTKEGISYACRSLPYTYNRMGGSVYSRLRRIVAGVAVELAFRRLLGEEKVPHDNLGMTHFTEPDRYDIALGGRRCDLKSYLVYHKDKIRRIHADPDLLLDAEAIVPVDQMNQEHHSDDDLYIFSFFSALITPTKQDLQKAVEAGQPYFMIHPLSKSWSRPEEWRSLAPLKIKSDLETPLHVEIGGQNKQKKFVSETLALPFREQVLLSEDYYALSYLHSKEIPVAKIGFHSPNRGKMFIAEPNNWGNIWVYGMKIFIVGYITRGEFRRKARRIPKGQRVFQYYRTQTENMAVDVFDLHPIRDLFVRARNWANQDARSMRQI